VGGGWVMEADKMTAQPVVSDFWPLASEGQ